MSRHTICNESAGPTVQTLQCTHVCSAGSQMAGTGDVRAGAVAEAGAKRSVINLGYSQHR